MLDIYYINLEHRNDRRLRLLENLKNFKKSDWPVYRVDAIYGDSINTEGSSGAVSQNEKACFFSHYEALKASGKSRHHSLVLEDDVSFSQSTVGILESAAGLLDESIDILFAEIGVVDAQSMLNLFLTRERLFKLKEFRLLELSDINFFGATAYIINVKSKGKLLKLLDEIKEVRLPIDEQFKEWIKEKKIAAKVILPFPITLAENAINSDIRVIIKPDIVNHSFRRMLGFDEDSMELDDSEINKFHREILDQKILRLSKIMSIQLFHAMNDKQIS
jgi:GR25 family glycosyltransferase involved in LPS biosynthesis